MSGGGGGGGRREGAPCPSPPPSVNDSKFAFSEQAVWLYYFARVFHYIN